MVAKKKKTVKKSTKKPIKKPTKKKTTVKKSNCASCNDCDTILLEKSKHLILMKFKLLVFLKA